ncbi:MAG: LPXTG cell wall anchor domain-containing protein [Culicoidibacterales bacterium]
MGLNGDINAETTLPETGDLNQAVTLFSGLTSLVAGAFVFGRRRK